MTYYEIHRLLREDYSISQINQSGITLEPTYGKKLSCHEQFVNRQCDRKKYLLSFEEFVETRLEKYQETSAAQMHNWLKEHHENFPIYT